MSLFEREIPLQTGFSDCIIAEYHRKSVKEQSNMSIRIGIIGYGNLGKGVECAIKQNPDMELAAVFTRRDPKGVNTHPFQRMWVRSSTTSYGSFNLDMDRSPGFGSTPTDSGPLKTWFPYGSAPEVLNLASKRNSPDRSTKSTRSCI